MNKMKVFLIITAMYDVRVMVYTCVVYVIVVSKLRRDTVDSLVSEKLQVTPKHLHRIGRVPALIASQTGLLAAGIACSFTQTIITFTIMRFVLALFVMSTTVIGFVYGKFAAMSAKRPI